MLLTDRFVFMHVPKTGGTFVTRVLRELLTPAWWDQTLHSVGRRYGVYFPLYPYKYRELRQHAKRSDIPDSYKSLPVLSCVRNPYDIYVSQFTFNWWRENPQRWFVDADATVRVFGPVEEMGFEEFVRATVSGSRWSATCRSRYPDLKPLSYCSTEWLHYHCLSPAEVVHDAAIESEVVSRAQEATQDVRFLITHRLNLDLHSFLKEMEYPEELIAPILTRGKVHPGPPRRDTNDHWSNHYDDELRSLVREHEWLLFECFPEFDAV